MQGARAPQPGATNRPSPSGHTIGPSAPDRSQRAPSSSAVRPPGRPERRPALSQPAPQRPPGAGGPGGRGTPGPMPNPEVKPASAEGTAGATLWETRAPPAPGARCAGLGAGMRERGAWEGGTRGGPPFRLRAPPAFSRRRKAAGPLGGGRPFAFGASCAGFAGLSAAFCMSPIRVARFWRVGVLKGASGSMPLAFDVLAPCSLHSLCLCRALFGGQTSERGL